MAITDHDRKRAAAAVLYCIKCRGKSMGKFEIFKDSAGEWRFRLKAANHETIAASEGYTTRRSAERGIDAVRRYAPTDSAYQSYQDEAGEWRFRLKAKNHETIAVSEGYTTRQGLERGIAAMKRYAPTATVHHVEAA